MKHTATAPPSAPVSAVSPLNLHVHRPAVFNANVMASRRAADRSFGAAAHPNRSSPIRQCFAAGLDPFKV